jgi:eukaryotic-like serine/threonine-protein kinase
MCIESRIRLQDVLREYLTKRGFRVLVLSDAERGLNRLKTAPPDCVILMGESIGDDIVRSFQQAVQLGASKSVVCIAVLGESQAACREQLEQSRTARVLVQPITLRELRSEIHLAFQRRLHEAS